MQEQMRLNEEINAHSELQIKNLYSSTLHQHVEELINIFNPLFVEEKSKFGQLITASPCNASFKVALTGPIQEPLTDPKEREEQQKKELYSFLRTGLTDFSKDFLASIKEIHAETPQQIHPQDKAFNALIEECDNYTQTLSLLPRYQAWMQVVDRYKLEISILRDAYQWSLQLIKDIYILNRDIQKGILSSSAAIKPIKEIFFIEPLIAALKDIKHNKLRSFPNLILTISQKSSEFITLVRRHQATMQKTNIAKVTCTIDHDLFHRSTIYLQYREQLETLLKTWEDNMLKFSTLEPTQTPGQIRETILKTLKEWHQKLLDNIGDLSKKTEGSDHDITQEFRKKLNEINIQITSIKIPHLEATANFSMDDFAGLNSMIFTMAQKLRQAIVQDAEKASDYELLLPPPLTVNDIFTSDSNLLNPFHFYTQVKSLITDLTNITCRTSSTITKRSGKKIDHTTPTFEEAQETYYRRKFTNEIDQLLVRKAALEEEIKTLEAEKANTEAEVAQKTHDAEDILNTLELATEAFQKTHKANIAAEKKAYQRELQEMRQAQQQEIDSVEEIHAIELTGLEDQREEHLQKILQEMEQAHQEYIGSRKVIHEIERIGLEDAQKHRLERMTEFYDYLIQEQKLKNPKLTVAPVQTPSAQEKIAQLITPPTSPKEDRKLMGQKTSGLPKAAFYKIPNQQGSTHKAPTTQPKSSLPKPSR